MYRYHDFQPAKRYQPTLALSPDGSQVVYSCNASGQFNLWRQPVDGGGAVQLTHYTDNTVRDVAWSPDGRTLVYTADHHGDEFHQVYRMPAAGGAAEALTDAPQAQHYLGQVDAFSSDGRFLLYSANDREPTVQDIHVRDLGTGDTRRLEGRSGLDFAMSFTPDGRCLMVYRAASNTDSDLYLVPLDDAAGEPLLLTPHEGDARFEPGPWTPDGSAFWVRTDAGRDHEAMGTHSLEPGGLTVTDAPDWGIDALAVAPDAGVLVWTVNEDGYSRLHARDLSTGAVIPTPAIPDGAVSALRVSRDGRRVAMLLATAVRPNEVAVVDLTSCTFTYLTDSRPDGHERLHLVEPELVRYTTHDGRQIPAFLYRPHGDGPFPVVLSIHGGPEYQERTVYNYGGQYQYLLASGVGVLAPNVRGSTGYGKAYQQLIHRDWGGDELLDFEHAVRYLRTLDWVDADRIGVYGGSFGGFATLSCVSRLPDLFAAAVSVVGPSNLVTFAKAVPPTWRSLMAQWVGDPDTEAEFLMQRSPITYVDAIRTPLFVIQGAKDPRVVKGESDQIVESLRARGVDVRYDVYDDEGHGFTKRENEARANGDTVDFLVTHLKAEPA